MKKTFTVIALVAVLFAACNNHDKSPSANTSGIDTIKTDSGITIVRNKEGKIIHSFPTTNLASTGNQAPNGTNGHGSGSMGVDMNEYPYYIKGTLEKGGGANITLDRLGIGNDIKPLQVETATPEGQFGFVGTCSQPQLMQLRLPAGKIQFIVRPKDTIDIMTTLEKSYEYTVTGSIESLQLLNMFNILEKANDKKDEIEERMKNARQNQPLYSHLLDIKPVEYAKIEDQKHADLRNFITKIDTSFVCLMASLYLNPNEDIEFMQKLDKKMVLRYPASKFYQALHEKVSIFSPIANGMLAPEIISQTPDGKTIKLSSLRGKYVFLNFWASFDNNNKEEAKNLRKLNDKYKSKGLEIVSYTVEKDKNAWTKAIADNKMDWINISDLLGYQSAGVGTYIVTEVPTSFLIDKEGHIIARNLKGSELNKKIAQLIH
jgi:peroxiredoxin